MIPSCVRLLGCTTGFSPHGVARRPLMAATTYPVLVWLPLAQGEGSLAGTSFRWLLFPSRGKGVVGMRTTLHPRFSRLAAVARHHKERAEHEARRQPTDVIPDGD